ncbi:MAG: hypothetical protein K0Q73_7398 [Paenibacillus sp.]|nr:hypothetical protein [Paenibacillus sp.]
MKLILFFDDHGLNYRSNLTRKSGKPTRISVFRDPYTDKVDLVSSYPNVYYNKETGKWQLVYNSYWPEHSPVGNMLLLAESDDGLSWTPSDTTDRIAVRDRLLPHQLLPHERHGEAATYEDPLAKREERYKALISCLGSNPHEYDSRLYTSPDCIRWTLQEDVKWVRKGVDLPASVYYNAIRQSYVITCRPRHADRRVGLIETKDWKTFSDPVLALQPDAFDTPLAEFYGMPVVIYENYYIGFLWVYHPELKQNYKYWDGKIDSQLTYSLNGWHYQRGLRDPFIGNGEPGEADWGAVKPYKCIDKGNGKLWIYASGSTHEHGRRPEGSGAILTYELRKDGFVYLESSGTGELATRAVYVDGDRLELNVQCPTGKISVQITDHTGQAIPGFTYEDCQAFTGDSVSWQPVWKDGANIGQLKGRVIKVEIKLIHGRLYGIRGSFIMLFGSAIALHASRPDLVPEQQVGL